MLYSPLFHDPRTLTDDPGYLMVLTAPPALGAEPVAILRPMIYDQVGLSPVF